METPPPLPAPESRSEGLHLPRPIATQAGRSSMADHRWPIAIKLVIVGVIIAILHVPVLLVWTTLDSRRQLRNEAVAEISQTWGADQILLGPVLLVPYTITTRVPRQTATGDRVLHTEELREVKGTAHFLPARLEVDGTLETSVRERGIFRTPVYAAAVTLSGEFHPDTTTLGLDRPVFDWSQARVLIGVTDPHGFRAAPAWRQGGTTAAFAPAAPRDGGVAGIEAPVAWSGPEAAQAPFTVTLSLQGSQRFAIVPVGEANTVTLQGGWPDPSFDGGYLPVERTVGPEGFVARWATTHFGRSFPSAWAQHTGRDPLRLGMLHGSAIGVKLLLPVDTYRMVERSLKYALLVLILVFAVYFLFEVTSAVRVHPLQYLMVGGALVLFYLGFLALAEFVAVAVAYGAAAGLSTALVAGYSWSALHTGRRSLLVAAGLGATYGYLYFMLQLQDYGLIAGTAALFTLLGLAMWLTRRLDWYVAGGSGGPDRAVASGE